MSDPLMEHIEGMQAIFDELQAEEEGIRKQLLAHQDKMRRIGRALDILNERERKVAKKPSAANWKVGEDKIEAVYGVLQSAEGSLTLTDLTTRTGISKETVRRAVYVLRSQDRIRKTGRTKVGSQKVDTFAVMPQAVNDAA